MQTAENGAILHNINIQRRKLFLRSFNLYWPICTCFSESALTSLLKHSYIISLLLLLLFCLSVYMHIREFVYFTYVTFRDVKWTDRRTVDRRFIVSSPKVLFILQLKRNTCELTPNLCIVMMEFFSTRSTPIYTK